MKKVLLVVCIVQLVLIGLLGGVVLNYWEEISKDVGKKLSEVSRESVPEDPEVQKLIDRMAQDDRKAEEQEK